MTTSKVNPKRILAIDPTSRGFGFVVLEAPTTLVDWGVKDVRQQDEQKTLVKISSLIQHYQPEIIVVEDYRRSRRCDRIRILLEKVCRLGTTAGLKSRLVPVSRVKKVFHAFRAKTKHEIAHAVAQQLPELAPQLPRYRKAWMSEDYQMAIFDAAALALSYLYSRRLATLDVPMQLPAKPNSLPVSDSL